MGVFYNILDIAACNFYISCTLPLPVPGVSNSSYQRRYKHLMTLGEPRIKQNMYVRSQSPNDLKELTITAIRSFDIAAKSQIIAPKVSHIDSEVQPKKALFIYAHVNMTTNLRLFVQRVNVLFVVNILQNQ